MRLANGYTVQRGFSGQVIVWDAAGNAYVFNDMKSALEFMK